MRELTLKRRPRIVGHKSFLDAVRHTQRLPMQRIAAETSERIAHRLITQGCWCDDRMALLLEGGIALTFVADAFTVPWELQDHRAFETSQTSWPSDPEPIRLIRTSVSGQTLVNVMDRAALMAGFIGRRARRIGVTEFGTYLHFDRDRRYLYLHGQVIQSTDQPLLEWFEDAD